MRIPFQHSYNRRCRGHDYRSRCIYMITILKAPHAPVFAVITRDPSKSKITPIVQPTPVGSIISECLTRLCVDYPCLRILNRPAVFREIFVRTEYNLAK